MTKSIIVGVVVFYAVFVGVCLKIMMVIRSRMRTQLSGAGIGSLKGVNGLPFDYQAIPEHRRLYPASGLRKSLLTLWAVHIAAWLTMAAFLMKAFHFAR